MCLTDGFILFIPFCPSCFLAVSCFSVLFQTSAARHRSLSVLSFLTARCIENHKDTFLDLEITIDENRFFTKIYHTVDDFDFEVFSFLIPKSTMSDHITCNSFYHQLVRFSSLCSKFNNFIVPSSNLLKSSVFDRYVLN